MQNMNYCKNYNDGEILFNPFRGITSEVMEQYSGQTLAIELDTGDILYAGVAVDVLQHKMRGLYPGVRYARLTLP